MHMFVTRRAHCYYIDKSLYIRQASLTVAVSSGMLCAVLRLRKR